VAAYANLTGSRAASASAAAPGFSGRTSSFKARLEASRKLAPLYCPPPAKSMTFESPSPKSLVGVSGSMLGVLDNQERKNTAAPSVECIRVVAMYPCERESEHHGSDAAE
jgi:hypothetical protein